MTHSLAAFDQLRSGMALLAVDEMGFTFGDCMEASWVALQALVDYDDRWAEHLVRIEGHLHHPVAMGDQGQGEHAWLEWREDEYPVMVIDPLVAKYLLDGHDPTGMRWVEVPAW